MYKNLNVVSLHAMKTYGGMEVQLRVFLTSAQDGTVGSFTPLPPYHEARSLRYPLNRQLGGTHSRFGRFGGEINSFPLLGIKPGKPGRLAGSLVAVLTDLVWFLNCGLKGKGKL